jgi:cysteine-rich repeat protein
MMRGEFVGCARTLVVPFVAALLAACADDGPQVDPTRTQLAEVDTSTGDATTEPDGTTTEPTTGTTDVPGPVCGDGKLDPGEQCDDGDVDNTDYCVEGCLLAICGDGFVQEGLEQCDDGNAADDDSCLVGCYAATCGDGNVYVGVEQCDDGNTAAGDGCDAACVIEEGPIDVCGDGVVGETEACDDGNTDDSDNCVGVCQAWTCGDGYVHATFETCDDANLDNGDGCVNVGGACVEASCGDGFVWDGEEECDDGNLSDSDECLNLCTLATCGDGQLLAGVEVCDDGMNTGEYGSCTPDCTALGPHCGDGLIEDMVETCDDGNLDPGDGCDESCQKELPPECYGYVELKEADRAATFNDGPGKITKCDTKTDGLWHRFMDPAGTVIPTVPPTLYSCGTDAPGWMMGVLPAPDEGIVARTACFAWEGNPCTWALDINVLNCEDYFVYQLPDPPETCLRYCASAI